ncbi:hypothetical protein ACQY0O_001396 [Thecaphora frezii]
MVAPQTLRKITKELITLSQTPLDGVRVVLNESDLLSFQAWIQGPPGTPYEGGYFQITFDFDGVDFPSAPPTCKFATKIFHPNVSRAGDICVSTLKKDWKPEYGIGRILVTIKCLLIAPNPDSALDPEASRLLQEEYDEYFETAKMWTSIHASRPPSNVDFSASITEASTATCPAPAPLTSTSPAGAVAAQGLEAVAAVATTAVAAATQTVATSVSNPNPTSAAAVRAVPSKKVAASGPKRGVRRL